MHQRTKSLTTRSSARRLARQAPLSLLIFASALAAGCDRSKEKSPPTGSAPPVSGADALPRELFVNQPFKDAVGVLQARRDVKNDSTGRRVTIRGRIGGRINPFVEGRAMFTLVDFALKTCAENPEDACKTPWDYCCEPADEIARHSATIQVAGPDGQLARADLTGVGGLAPMAIVEVEGTVVPQSSEASLVVSAERIHVRSDATEATTGKGN